MEVTALCIRLMMTVFLQLGAHAQKDDAAFWIIPTRLQLFEYDPVSFKCVGSDGLTGWSVLRRNKTDTSTCGSKWGVSHESSCTIKNAYPEDSGEYWCETGRGKKSNIVNVSVTAGSVILESPVLPVTEGNDVTLSCRNKKTSSKLTADFYKDGRVIRSSSTGEMTIHSVSWSDEGLYKCNISGAGESPDSRLAVREHTHTSSDPSSSSPTPWIVVSVLLIVLLLALGLLHLGKGYWHRVLLYLSTPTPASGSAEDQTDEDELSPGAVYYTLGLAVPQHLAESAGTTPSSTDTALYSTIQKVAK
ncbi:low affinity immunoglobulin gamma Fc region receptor III-like isoform X5 [Sebastes umbrosus]|uniref:low affinity immunoglobulin gamma Fc region receptor III-like isoform X5 n=1 Tax=Sebastes umbrosus TaxID=72105 RepID=UPI00189EF341|nr:low affinity immunoglobulin gamma Fc region receptor III-like isoform X5 [Sebastes umbrosus]